MSDPLAGIPLPANVITPDVAEVIAAAPQPVDWDARGTVEDRIGQAMADKLWLMFGGIGEPHE